MSTDCSKDGLEVGAKPDGVYSESAETTTSGTQTNFPDSDMTSDNSIALQLITKMDELLPEDSVVDVCTSVFEDTCIYDIKMSDLLLLLQKIDCESEAIVHKLEKVIKGWDILGRRSNLHREHENFRKTIWFNKEVKATTDSEFSLLWNKICCLLYAIEYGEIQTIGDEANNFSPLGTLLKLGHIMPNKPSSSRKRGEGMSRLPSSPIDSRFDTCYFCCSVLRMLGVISIISPLDLFRLDCNGRNPLHNAATAFYSSYEQECECSMSGNSRRFIDDFDGITMNSNYRLWEGEQIFSYLLARYDSQRALEKDKNGDTVLSILLKDMHRRPIVRIWLVLEAFPRLCSSGNIPFYDALDMPNDMYDKGSVMDQLYLNNCYINAYNSLGLKLNSSPEDILRRFYLSIEVGDYQSGEKYLDEYSHNVQSTALMQAGQLLSITGTTQYEPKLLIEVLDHINSMSDRFDPDHYDDYMPQDQIESAAKLLIEVTVGESHIDVSFFIERAFSNHNGYDCMYNRDMRTIFYQWVLKALLKCRLGDCTASIELFLNHAIPYYKAMATYCTDAIFEIQEDQEEQGPAAEKQIAEEKEELQEIAIETNLLMTSLLASSPNEELCCCDCARKPLLHIALKLASGYDGIALSILGIEPSSAKVRHNEELPIHVALRNGCEGFVIEKLLSLFPESVTTKDGDGLYPFMLAASSCVDLDYVYLLLRKYPSGIMQ